MGGKVLGFFYVSSENCCCSAPLAAFAHAAAATRHCGCSRWSLAALMTGLWVSTQPCSLGGGSHVQQSSHLSTATFPDWLHMFLSTTVQ